MHKQLNPWELPWQNKAWEKFYNAFTKDKLHHAWIVEGDRDFAADKFIESICQLVNCQNLLNLRPCKQCSRCKQIESGNYPDVFRLKVLEKKVFIGVDQVRDVSNSLTKKAYSGCFRIVVVENAEQMNLASSNAFLKTLEEPGQKVLILLQTAYPTRMLPTLRSRCQQVSLTNTKSSELENWLKLNYPQNSNLVKEALEIASYKPLVAGEFIENNVVKDRNNLFQNIDQLLSGNMTLQQFEKCHSTNPKRLLTWLEQYLVIKARIKGPYREKINQFYSVFEQIRLQFLQTRDADKPLLLREILIKWIALSANMSHS